VSNRRSNPKLKSDSICAGIELNRYIIVFAPHPDDETLGCGGTIIKKNKEGYKVIIVFITDGRYAFSNVLGITSNPSPEELKEIRRMEALKATKILGISEGNLYFLDFEDRAVEKQRDRVEKRILEILERYLPEEIYFPSDKDYHTDHRVTNQIVSKSIRKIGLTTKAYKYSIMQRYSRIGPAMDRFINLFKRNLIRSDISSVLSQKITAIEQYKSQITLISLKQDRPILMNLKRFLKKTEKFYL